ncbi:MAG: glycosyltransferase family 2 protein [Pseudomonadota bacterium]
MARGSARIASRPRLGGLLRDRGVAPRQIDRALQQQRRVRQPLGLILRHEGAATAAQVIDGLAAQTGMMAVDLARHRADPDISAPYDARLLLRLGGLPWRIIAGSMICAIHDPATAESLRAALAGAGRPIFFVLADRAAIEDEIARLHGPAMAAMARDRCPEHLSCRVWASHRSFVAVAVPFLIAGGAWLAPAAALFVLLAWITLFGAATTAMRAVALVESIRPPPRTRRTRMLPMPAAARPVVSVLVPLFDEDVTLSHLIDAIDRSSYPKALLEVILILEQDDLATPLALAQIGLPPWARTVTVPPGSVRTKPRAMNYALEFCSGSVIGIYDAEDRPEPDQLEKVVRHLHHAPRHVGCVQGYLDFYNSRQNWLARCFTIEYATWFRVLLRGMQRLGMPIPLGGTTVFFRRDALESVGAWDAHNVTEDADLGMRLARFGYRTEMVETTTYEEANCRLRAWVPQRARWLKGYAMTWFTHMRRPRALWRDLGPMGFAGFQLLLLGGLTAYLGGPVFWGILAAQLLGGAAAWPGPAPLWQIFFATMIIGQVIMFTVALRAVIARPRRHLLTAVPLLLIYWPLGAVAAYRAVWDLFRRPFHWSKTQHGL